MLETESLLRPIREDAPTGENLRDDPSPGSPYYQLKDARNAARAAERAAQGLEDPSSATPANWRPVLELAPSLLSDVSKDIEVGTWLIEALVREEGFAGLQNGFEITRRLIEEFWDGLYPLPDEEGVRTRVAPLTGLNGDDSEGTLLAPIGMVPLLADDKGLLTSWHYHTAREIEAITDAEAKQRRIDTSGVSLERFAAGIAMADPGDLFALVAEVESCIKEFGDLSAALDERCGQDGPPTSSIRHALEEVLDCLRFLTKDLTPPVDPSEEEGADGEGGGDGTGSGQKQKSAPGVIASREDAVEAMRRVRDYYRRTEPHSPVSYVVDQALRWSQMPLHQLVSELIADTSARTAFQLRTGMTSDSEQAQES